MMSQRNSIKEGFAENEKAVQILFMKMCDVCVIDNYTSYSNGGSTPFFCLVDPRVPFSNTLQTPYISITDYQEDWF